MLFLEGEKDKTLLSIGEEKLGEREREREEEIAVGEEEGESSKIAAATEVLYCSRA